MKRKTLEDKLAKLESVNDQLITELEYIDNLMRSIGFSQGINSVKGVATEIINEKVEFSDDL